MANEMGEIKSGAMPWINERQNGIYVTKESEYFEKRFDILEKTSNTVFQIEKYIDDVDTKDSLEYSNVRFKSVMSMIYNATNVQCISYHSLKGFVFVIECKENEHQDQLDLLTTLITCVDPNDDTCFKERIEYTTPRTSGNRRGRSAIGKPITKYNTRINQFILKISFLHHCAFNAEDTSSGAIMSEQSECALKIRNGVKDKAVPYMFHGCRKEMDIRSEFVKEAKTQTEIFESTYDFVPMTYSVLDLSIIETPDDMNAFLQLLQLKTNTTQDYSILSEMMKINKTNMQMGLLSMEYGDKYKVYSTFPQSDLLYINITIQILFNIMILFIEYQIIHVDLHKNNIMVYHDIRQIESSNAVNTQNGIKPYVFIIDYGRTIEDAIVINDFDEYFTYMNKHRIDKTRLSTISESITFIVEQIKQKGNKATIMDFLNKTYKRISSKQRDLKYVLLLLYSCYCIIKMLLQYEFDYYKKHFSKIYFQSFHIYQFLFDDKRFKNKIDSKGQKFIFDFLNTKIREIQRNIDELDEMTIDINNMDIAQFIQNDKLFKLLDYLYVFYIKWKSKATPKNIDHTVFTIFEKTIQSIERYSVLSAADMSDINEETMRKYENIDEKDIPKELHKLRRECLTTYLQENPISSS